MLRGKRSAWSMPSLRKITHLPQGPHMPGGKADLTIQFGDDFRPRATLK